MFRADLSVGFCFFFSAGSLMNIPAYSAKKDRFGFTTPFPHREVEHFEILDRSDHAEERLCANREPVSWLLGVLEALQEMVSYRRAVVDPELEKGRERLIVFDPESCWTLSLLATCGDWLLLRGWAWPFAAYGRAPHLEAAPGFEPGNRGFADPRLTTWLCRLNEMQGEDL